LASKIAIGVSTRTSVREELGGVDRRRRSRPELVVARQQEGTAVFLAGPHRGTEGRRLREAMNKSGGILHKFDQLTQ
jgi:hypothetical protein